MSMSMSMSMSYNAEHDTHQDAPRKNSNVEISSDPEDVSKLMFPQPSPSFEIFSSVHAAE